MLIGDLPWLGGLDRSLPTEKHIRQRTEPGKLRRVFGQTFIPELAVSPEVFDHPEGMFHLGGGKFGRMNNRRPLRLHPNMPFGSNVPLVVFTGRAHLGAPFFATVLLAHGLGQQCRIHNRPGFQHQPLGR